MINKKSCRAISILFLGWAAMVSPLASAQNAPAGLVPPGLLPGDNFYIMFVTSTQIAGNDSVAAYNAHVKEIKANRR